LTLFARTVAKQTYMHPSVSVLLVSYTHSCSGWVVTCYWCITVS